MDDQVIQDKFYSPFSKSQSKERESSEFLIYQDHVGIKSDEKKT